MLNFRQLFTGSVIRAIAEIKDAGEVLLGYVVSSDGSDVATVAKDKSDVFVNTVETMSGLPLIGRLFAASNILWRLPKDQDSCMILRPADAHGPGVPYILHGDGAQDGTQGVPNWLSTSNCGLSAPETLHLESTAEDVKIDSGSGKVVNIQDGDKGIARKDDPVTHGSLVFAFGPGPTATLSITYNPGDGGAPQILAGGSGTITLGEKILSASTKAKCG